MHNLHTYRVEAHRADLERSAGHRGPALAGGDPGAGRAAASAQLSVRLAHAGDDEVLQMLAQLDAARVPPAPLLIGSVGDRQSAALSLLDGSAVADPFVPTAELLALMRMRARQLEAGRGRLRRRAWGPLLRGWRPRTSRA